MNGEPLNPRTTIRTPARCVTGSAEITAAACASECPLAPGCRTRRAEQAAPTRPAPAVALPASPEPGGEWSLGDVVTLAGAAAWLVLATLRLWGIL